MTRARRELVSLDSTPYYHCVSRCVRRAFLCGEDNYTRQNYDHRRQWVQDRLKQLADVFAIKIAAFAIMSNHYHIVVRINRDEAIAWSDEEVMDRWYELFKGNLLVDRFRSGEVLTDSQIDAVKKVVEKWRDRLYDLGWFMRCLNEHVARKANEEDGCKGHFWESRYKSQALLDEKALLSCMSYVDLNPIRAKLADTPESSDFTSIQERIRDFAQSGEQVEAKPQSLYHLLKFSGDEALNKPADEIAFRLDDYIALVDWTGRAIRQDKRGSIPEHLPPIFERLNMSSDNWLQAVQKASHSYGLAKGPIERIKDYAQRLGKKWMHGQSYCKVFYRFAPD
jgi:REP element-mobilizing transposase RayT